MNATIDKPKPRKLYCVLSARSLPYATSAFESLRANCLDEFDLTLLTDAAEDKGALVSAVERLGFSEGHRCRVFAQSEADERAEALLGRHPNVAAFRFGHPCWRKVTDPLLFASPDEEMVILDPDLYFPNRFRFEPTPEKGLLLMYQPPSCLLPEAVVLRAYDNGISLAHHVDIGVCQVRNNVDLEWLDWLIGRLGGKNLPRSMHVEAIVWAAMAMRMGGGYLDPTHWHCWRHSQWNRLLLRLGATGRSVLRSERFEKMKCFHGGGIAKWWIPEAVAAGDLPTPSDVLESRPSLPFEELTRAAYESRQRLKAWARRAGYYRFVKS